MFRLSKGQTILEYVIFFTAVVVVCVTFLAPNGFFKRKLESSLNLTVDHLEGMVEGIEY